MLPGYSTVQGGEVKGERSVGKLDSGVCRCVIIA